MKRSIKIALAAGALVLAGGAIYGTVAVAEHRGPGWHKGHHGKHWRGHRGHKHARLMERFDSDKNGKLTQEELDQARKALLAKHDANKDGKLTLAEFEALWVEFMRHRMVRGFQRIDRDGSAEITVEEFLRPYSDIVERLDRNDDGVLDKEDRRQKRGRGFDRDDDDRPGPRGPGPRNRG